MNTTSADLVKAEIIRQRLYNIAQEMGIVMIRTTGDPTISEAVDFSTFIADKDGEIISFSGYITIHAGPARQAVKHILNTYGKDEIKPGDAFICNDPHTTGSCHPPDVGIVKPIFYENELVAWCWAEAHLLDVGGMTPGGFAIDAYDAYSEALRFPGIKIVNEGKVNEDIFKLIQANFRMPQHDINNIRCFIAACNMCEKRIHEMIDKYGLEEFKYYLALNKDLTEKAFKERITQLPDKTYESIEWIEHNGHEYKLLPVKCKMTIDGDKMKLDFTGTAPQTDGFVNIAEGTAIGAIVTPIMLQLAPDIPFNEGIFRALEIILPKGSVVNCTMPAPVSSGHMEAGLRVVKTVSEVFSLAMMESDNEWVRSHAMGNFHENWVVGVFSGENSDGRPTVFLDTNGGGAGGGAQTVCDGLDAAASFTGLSNGLPDIEINEMTSPLLYLWRKINVNSGGPGNFRGGQGIEFAWIPWGTDGGREIISSTCSQVPARGIMGGFPGGTSGHWLIKSANVKKLMSNGKVPTFEMIEGEKELLPAKYSFPISSEDVFVQFEGGGGGLGDPLKRNPERVRQDLYDGYITTKMAEDVYGVIVNEDGQVDYTETSLKRAMMKRQRIENSVSPKISYQNVEKNSLREIKPVGEALTLKEDNSGKRYYCCAECQSVITSVEEDWFQGAGLIRTEITRKFQEFDMWVRGRDEEPKVYLDEYICADCGSMLYVSTSVNETN